MRTFAIGDLQGCFDELERLLAAIEFDERQDKLWFVGDIINRGPQSLECLRYVKQATEQGFAQIVLGNHDFHLLAAYAGLEKYLSKSDTLEPIFAAEDVEELVNWLRMQPLVVKHDIYDAIMVHAGIPPQWSIEESIQYADEVHQLLRGDDWQIFLKEHLFGNQSKDWFASIKGWERIRYIVNAFVRMRYVAANGELEFKAKNKPDPNNADSEYQPWFTWSNRNNKSHEIFFGHWSTLGVIDAYNIHALDTGCLWGGTLTAYCIEEKKRYCIECEAKQKPKTKKKSKKK